MMDAATLLDRHTRAKKFCACGRFTKQCPRQVRVTVVSVERTEFDPRDAPGPDVERIRLKARYRCMHCETVHAMVLVQLRTVVPFEGDAWRWPELERCRP